MHSKIACIPFARYGLLWRIVNRSIGILHRFSRVIHLISPHFRGVQKQILFTVHGTKRIPSLASQHHHHITALNIHNSTDSHSH